FLDVVRERLQRGDVHHLCPVRERAVEPLAHQRIDRRQEGGERLAGARGRGDQGVPPRLDQRPGVALRLSRLPKTRLEPALNGGMEALKRHTEIWRRFPEGVTLGEYRRQRQAARRRGALDRLTDLVVGRG